MIEYVIKCTLNEKVFAELVVQIEDEKIKYRVTCYFRNIQKIKTDYFEDLERAKNIYNFVIQ